MSKFLTFVILAVACELAVLSGWNNHPCIGQTSQEPKKEDSLPKRRILGKMDQKKAEELIRKEAEMGKTKVTGLLVVPKEMASFEGRVVEIQLFKIADKAADLVEKVELQDFSHKQGTETKKDFVIGAKARLEKEMKYYLTVFLLKDGQRTHIGEVPGKFLCTVLTKGQPREVTLKIRPVR